MKCQKINNFGKLSHYEESTLVLIEGWVHQRRLLGRLIFWIIRRNNQFVQVVIRDCDLITIAKRITVESVLQITGHVKQRKGDSTNTSSNTCASEIVATQITILNNCRDLPFPIRSKVLPGNKIINRYQYLHLRSTNQYLLRMRAHKLALIRNIMTSANFVEIETPILTTPSPEGATEFYTPFVRENSHLFSIYALAQSPQIYKQLLMCGGVDKYFQIAKCFRNEDLRHDRQPEFTQLDLEQSFATQSDIFKIVESCIEKLFLSECDNKLSVPFQQLSFTDALQHYGTDKPDLRYCHKIVNFTHLKKIFVEQTQLLLYGLLIPEQLALTIQQFVKNFCSGEQIPFPRLVSFDKNGNFNIQSSSNTIQEFLSSLSSASVLTIADDLIHQKIANFRSTTHITILLLGGNCHEQLCKWLGALRTILICKTEIPPSCSFSPVWITKFPLFKWIKHEGKIASCHNPFTKSVHELSTKHLEMVPQELLALRSTAYDLVINGIEVGGGSERIYKAKQQLLLFKIIGINDNIINEKFGSLLTALDYGMPPSAGIALGIDRLLMLVSGSATIRSVIAFPKLQNGRDAVLTHQKSLPSFSNEIGHLQKTIKYYVK